jgi:hypothetical protein
MTKRLDKDHRCMELSSRGNRTWRNTTLEIRNVRGWGFAAKKGTDNALNHEAPPSKQRATYFYS